MKNLPFESQSLVPVKTHSPVAGQKHPVPATPGSHSCRASGRQILIADRDKAVAGFLSAELEADGFHTEQIHDGEAAWSTLEAAKGFDLLILDLSFPKADGTYALDRLALEHPGLPVLVLSSNKAVDEKVRALHAGADDYLTKPLSVREFLARVHALLRRTSLSVPNQSAVGDLTIHRDELRVERNGRSIELTPREFALLDALMQNAGRPVSRKTLLQNVWKSAESSTNIVDVYMKYVRDKIDHPGENPLVRTVRGFGYELRNSLSPVPQLTAGAAGVY